MHLLKVYDCLCDATRLRVLHLLAERPLCVCHFEAVLRVPQAKISRHLAYLRRHGLVTASHEGPWRIYALASPAPAGLQSNLLCLRKARTTERVLQQDLLRLEKIVARDDCGCGVPAAPRRALLRATQRS